jgi:hypothetical protein
MSADVDKAMQLTAHIAGEDDGHVIYREGEEIARLGHLLGQTNVLPGAPKDALLFQPKEVFIGIPIRRERFTALQRGLQVGVPGRGQRHCVSLMFWRWCLPFSNEGGDDDLQIGFPDERPARICGVWHQGDLALAHQFAYLLLNKVFAACCFVAYESDGSSFGQ